MDCKCSKRSWKNKNQIPQQKGFLQISVSGPYKTKPRENPERTQNDLNTSIKNILPMEKNVLPLYTRSGK